MTELYFSSLLDRVEELGQSVFSLLAEFATIPLVLQKALVPLVRTNEEGSVSLVFGVTNYSPPSPWWLWFLWCVN